MAPRRSCSANDALTLLAEVLAHLPSVDPRTVIFTGTPPRLGVDRKLHSPALRASSHPPDAAAGCPVSIVWAEHLVTIRVSVTLFEKSTSYIMYLPNGVHCTDRVLIFGGRSTP